MKYVNAKDVLPPEVLREVQKYSGGALIYVPKKEADRIGWGQLNGAKAHVAGRNRSIITAYHNGTSVIQLMKQHCLSEASIRKIIYNKASLDKEA
ncbi:MAG: CD3324 family protein [Defluviitaleaceae bacterium]|nr:CD3324 family protein [Defluviitaleaceae bacterium]